MPGNAAQCLGCRGSLTHMRAGPKEFAMLIEFLRSAVIVLMGLTVAVAGAIVVFYC